jgi:hypothetical protein
MASVSRLTENPVRRRGARNPYVGPRAFREEDRLYGRDRELAELVDMLVSERVVLMHSPSGAGKTSLIQASLIPELRRQRFRPLPCARVNLPVQAEPNLNRYALSVMLSLESKLRPAHQQRSLRDLSTMSLAEYLRGEAENALPPAIAGFDNGVLGAQPLVVIIDQFEEILLLNPADQAGQRTFFRQLGDALEEQRLWVLFAMREEYMGALDKFAYALPTSLNVRYRLDLLTREAATSAIQRPAKDFCEVTVSNAATELLVKNLSIVFVQRPGGSTKREESPYVEGVILQTVCSQLWDEIDPIGKGYKNIQPKHLGDLEHVDRALAQYYADAVRQAAQSGRIRERLIRDWFEDVLITQQGFRSQADSGPGTDARKAFRCVQSLEKQHLLRSEPRLNRPWYELVHDRFIDPIRRDNSVWRQRLGFDDISRRAKAWRDERSSDLLLVADDLAEAIIWLDEHEGDIYDYEREFVRESERVQSELEQKELEKLVAHHRETIYHGVFLQLNKSRQRWRVATLVAVLLGFLAVVITALL